MSEFKEALNQMDEDLLKMIFKTASISLANENAKAELINNGFHSYAIDALSLLCNDMIVSNGKQLQTTSINGLAHI